MSKCKSFVVKCFKKQDVQGLQRQLADLPPTLQNITPFISTLCTCWTICCVHGPVVKTIETSSPAVTNDIPFETFTVVWLGLC